MEWAQAAEATVETSEVAETVAEACGDDPNALCEFVVEETGSGWLAWFSESFIDRPVRILLVIVAAFIVSRVLRFVLNKFGKLLAKRSAERVAELEKQKAVRSGESEAVIARAKVKAQSQGRLELRANTFVSVASSLLTVFVWAVAAVVVVGLFDVSLAPLFAGAGVLGVALGFGAQTVVSDFLSGMFMVTEDQFGVGDVIDVGEASGTVEKVSLRVTTLRDVHGTVWHVRNSEIKRVANKSQVWSRAVLDIEVAYDTDLRRAEGIIQHVADELWKDPEFDGGDIIDPPSVWGVERLGADGVVIRLVVKTDPAEQWMIARELRLRIKDAFDRAGIEIPFPQRTVWIRKDETVPRSERPHVETAPIRVVKVTEDMVNNPNV